MCTLSGPEPLTDYISTILNKGEVILPYLLWPHTFTISIVFRCKLCGCCSCACHIITPESPFTHLMAETCTGSFIRGCPSKYHFQIIASNSMKTNTICPIQTEMFEDKPLLLYNVAAVKLNSCCQLVCLWLSSWIICYRNAFSSKISCGNVYVSVTWPDPCLM